MSDVHRGPGAGVSGSARAASVLTAAMLTASLLVAAVVTGNAPASVAARPVPVGGALDYGVDAATPVAPVRPEFIADRLGTDIFSAPVSSSSGAGSPTRQASAPPPASRPGSGQTAEGKEFRCVGGRQTDDPLAPPCDDTVFDGDNGGATWSGVSRDEVRILVRIEGGEDVYLPPPAVRSTPDSGQTPADQYLDLGLPPRADEPIGIEGLRDLQTYFNRRYQTYGRRLRLIVYFDSGYSLPESTAAPLAVENDVLTDPFAAISLNRDAPFVDDYLVALARRGVVAFDGWQYRSRRFFATAPGFLWSYHASIDQQAELFASYVCTKVVGHPVAIAGDPLLRGAPRRLALLHTANPSQRDYRALAARIRTRLEACGASIVAEATYRTNGEECTNLPHEQDEDDIRKARADLARFRAAGVTTILWPGCPTSAHPVAATLDAWLPEWVLVGDPYMSQAGIAGTVAGAAAAWDGHAVMVSARPFQPPLWETRCWAAIEEVDPGTDEPQGRFDSCTGFGPLQQVVAGVQLAGPRLDPSTFAAGFRQLVVRGSSDPQVPSCVYTAGDYSCIKDGQALLFDAGGSTGQPTLVDGLSRGGVLELPQPCWRAIEGGRRYLAGAWPPGNVDAQFGPADTCTYDQQHLPREAFRVGRL